MIPTALDFGVDDLNDLDARHAWDEFGGLSIDDAFTKFISHPLCYQEDFMFMGGAAFAYYFPVIDRYLREFRASDEPNDDDDSYAAVIAGGFCSQLLQRDLKPLSPILEQICELVAFVRNHTDYLASCPRERLNIASTWQVLEAQITQLRNEKTW